MCIEWNDDCRLLEISQKQKIITQDRLQQRMNRVIVK